MQISFVLNFRALLLRSMTIPLVVNMGFFCHQNLVGKKENSYGYIAGRKQPYHCLEMG